MSQMSQSTDIRITLDSVTKNSFIVTLGMYEITELKVESTRMQSLEGQSQNGTYVSTLAELNNRY